MDIPIIAFMKSDADYRRYFGVNSLPDSLWDGSLLARDTSGFSVLAVDRFRGPRLNDSQGTHAYWELVAVLGGAGELTGPSGQAVRRPDVLLIPPGVVHGEHAEDHLDTVWVAVAGSRLRDLGGGVVTVRDEDLCRLAEELWMQAAVRTDRSGGELDGLALTLLGRFQRLSGSPQGGDVVDQAVRWLHQHLDQPVQIADLAGQLRISPPHLHRLFKQRTRSSPKAFLNALRIERAAHLLRHTALPVVRVAALVGFDDPLYFSRVFTRSTGLAPGRFRTTAR